MPSRVTSVTTRRFPPELLAELVHDVIYEITDPRNLLPACPFTGGCWLRVHEERQRV
jgi:hypothetical protein